MTAKTVLEGITMQLPDWLHWDPVNAGIALVALYGAALATWEAYSRRSDRRPNVDQERRRQGLVNAEEPRHRSDRTVAPPRASEALTEIPVGDFGWAWNQPKLPLAQYKQPFAMAWLAMTMYREPGVVGNALGVSASSMLTPQQSNRLLEKVMAERDQLQSHLRPLEDIRPDVDDLMDLHIKLIAYLRAMLIGESLRAEGMRQDILGNDHIASSHLAESEVWEVLRLQHRRAAIQAMLALKEYNHWVFSSLGLEEDTVLDLLR